MVAGATERQKPEAAEPREQVGTGTRARRTLTTRQQQALETFGWLGADLAPDFSAGQLRRAFRALARRYHPDRHPRVSDAERARLARTFAELCDCHRLLVPAAQPVRH
jgi:hypothetical protein